MDPNTQSDTETVTDMGTGQVTGPFDNDNLEDLTWRRGFPPSTPRPLPPNTTDIYITESSTTYVAVNEADVASLGAIGLCDFLQEWGAQVAGSFTIEGDSFIVFNVSNPSLSIWRDAGLDIVEIGSSVNQIKNTLS